MDDADLVGLVATTTTGNYCSIQNKMRTQNSSLH